MGTNRKNYAQFALILSVAIFGVVAVFAIFTSSANSQFLRSSANYANNISQILNIRFGEHPDKTRIVLDIKHPTNLSYKISKDEQKTRVSELLTAVELLPSVGDMYPHELSGGMKQRVAIAIATSMDPKVIVADEPTSALDVVVQRTVMQTLGRLQEGLEASIVLVGHDMGLVAQFADFVGVMYAGKMVELGPVNSVFEKPLHPYTRLLIRSLPTLENKEDFIGIPGLPPPLLNLPPGCTFCTRFDRENKNDPPWKEVSKDHWISECNVCSDIGK